MWRCFPKIHSRTTSVFDFFKTINDLQAVVRDLLLCADDSWIVFQDKNVTGIEKQLLREFSCLCDWFVDDNLSVHFGPRQKKINLFSTKRKVRNAKALSIVYKGT